MFDTEPSYPLIVRVELERGLAETGAGYWRDRGHRVKIVERTASALRAQARIFVVVLVGRAEAR